MWNMRETSSKFNDTELTLMAFFCIVSVFKPKGEASWTTKKQARASRT